MSKATLYMLLCDGCGAGYPAMESLRGAGEPGVAMAREIAAQDGWSAWPETDHDYCPKCTKGNHEAGL